MAWKRPLTLQECMADRRDPALTQPMMRAYGDSQGRRKAVSSNVSPDEICQRFAVAMQSGVISSPFTNRSVIMTCTTDVRWMND